MIIKIKQSMNKIMVALKASNMFNMIWLSNSFVTDTTRKTNRKITVVVYLKILLLGLTFSS